MKLLIPALNTTTLTSKFKAHFKLTQHYISNAFLSLTCCIMIFLGGCAEQKAPVIVAPEPEVEVPQEPRVRKSDKVALLLPLSGRHSSIGQSMQKAAEMSLFDHAGDRLNVSMYDTQSTPQGAQLAAQRAVNEGVGLILGPVFSDHVQNVSGIARRAGVNVVSFSNNKSIAGSGVYTLGFSPEDQINAIVRYAAEQGKRSIAVMIPRNAYGSLVEKTVRNAQANLGISVEFVSYSLETDQLIKDLNPLRTMSIDALFIPEGGRALSQIISTALYQEMSFDGIQLLGTGQWDDRSVIENRTLHGAWVASSNPVNRNTFDQKYRTAYGEAPNRLATLAYDSVSMLAVLRRHNGTSAFSTNSLTQNRGFDGVDGVFRLQQSGVSERKLAILTVTPGGLVPLKMADGSF